VEMIGNDGWEEEALFKVWIVAKATEGVKDVGWTAAGKAGNEFRFLIVGGLFMM